ncbi:flagellar protein FlaG [Tumebacillus permanentifrigoris]|uniref:Putative FlaG/YvyC family protein n=1 Tax=Tumebacillus permanentifrigoris TaxID=378543 RepID=A0A316DD65_9BACL|nr:flagellar protein FlaG [Tumebacillus permanentifrigoris]PWK16167.1 putative FlaG/YvyC family protein [Tumebacillus permanentifrigoris]
MQISKYPQPTSPVEAEVRVQAPSPAPAKKVTAEQVTDGMARLRKKLEEMQGTKVQMNYDKDIDRVIIRYTSQSTGEVVHQIPTEKFVEFEKEFIKSVGLLFDHKA